LEFPPLLHEQASTTYREVVERLRAHGFVFDRPAKGSHEILAKIR
jgi:hypothetical protein